MKEMDRYHGILADEEYIKLLGQMEEYEKDRIYCCHGLEHVCDVARIMYILALEEGSGLSQDVIYATALLHDIGRIKQYESGIPHHEASVDMAGGFLARHGYEQTEIAMILDAIHQHRVEGEQLSPLADYLYRADKLSRNCFCCKASDTCKWPIQQRNQTIEI